MDDLQLSAEVPRWSWRELLLLVFRRRRVCRVDGESMRPALEDGDRVLYVPAGAFSRGDVVLARHPVVTDLLVIKRVEAVGADGRVDLRGDAGVASSDSRGFGPVRLEAIVGRVTCRL